MKANVSKAGEVVGEDEVAGFDGDATSGGGEVGPRGKVGAEDVEGVADVGAEDGFVGGTAGEVVVTIGIEGAAVSYCSVSGTEGCPSFIRSGSTITGCLSFARHLLHRLALRLTVSSSLDKQDVTSSAPPTVNSAHCSGFPHFA